MVRVRACIVLGLFSLTGCATTSGRDWLSAPVEPSLPALEASAGDAWPAAEARPRLSHTVTLGETYAAAPAPALPADAAQVQVNVNTQVPVVINNIGGYGYGYGYGYGGYGLASRSGAVRASGAVHAASTDTKVGADFPAPPDYGPRALR